MKKAVLSCFALCASVAFAGLPTPLLVPDYDRDGDIGATDRGKALAGEKFTVWINDDDDAEGTEDGAEAGDTNNDLHDVPGREGNDKDCEDDRVNGRCDLLDFFPVLIDVKEVVGWDGMTWMLSSESVNVVFTGLDEHKAGSFHTREVKALDGDTPLYKAAVTNLTEDGVELPSGFLNQDGKGVFLIEGRDQGSQCLTLRGYNGDAVVAEVTMNLDVKNVEDLYGWMNLRPKENEAKNEGEGEQWKIENSTVQPSTFNLQPDRRHFILVHGYNANHDEARGNAAEFYKKLYQSGSDAMMTAVEWKGDQSQIKFEELGVNFSPNYFVNVENAFAAARPFADACKKLLGEKILVAHSLGNVLVSSAIKDYGLDYTKYVMLNAAVPREAFDANAYDEDMVDEDWLDDKAKVQDEGEGEGGNSLTNHLDRAARWYRNFAGKEYDPYEYRRKLAWRGRFANLPRTVNYYSPTDNILLNPDPNEKDPDKVIDRNDPEIYNKVRLLLLAKLVNGRSIGRGGSKKTGFGFWSFSEKMKGTWLLDVVNDVLTNMLEVAQADAYKCEGGWGENDDYEEKDVFDPANTRFTPFLDERMKTRGMLDILPAETERLRAQHLADAIPAESFAAGANEVATVENVNEESFIGWNPDWPLYEGEEGEGTRTNLWNHSAFREVAFYHTSKFYASLAAVGKPRVIIDTDLGSSMDDLFAVDLAARMHKAGKLDLMAVMMDRPDHSEDKAFEGEFLTFADRYLASLGLGDLPIGTAMGQSKQGQTVFNPYWTLIHSNNVTGVGLLLPTNRTPEQIASLTNAVALYRRLLNSASDKSVVVCSTGFLTNLEALMKSGEDYEKDGSINVSGMDLIAAKVKELRIMGGCFDYTVAPDGTDGAEYNFAGDPVAAKLVVEEWPTPVVLSTWEAGLKLEYKPKDVLADFPAGTFDPVIRSAYTYWPEPLNPGDRNRLWDPMTVLPLTEGETLVPLSEMGGVTVDEKGKTTFTPDPSSNRCYQVASNMNANAVMNRLRAIYRTGNPSLPDAVRCIKDAGVDYNGHDLTFKVPKFSLGAYSSNDVHVVFAFGDKSYAPDEVTYDPVLEVFSVHFTVPKEDATAGNFYNGALTITLGNEKLGPNVVKVVPTQIVQGAIDSDTPEEWFYETNLEAPTNYVPAKVGKGDMPERRTATVQTTFTFEAATPETDEPPDGEAQAAVRIVEDAERGGYKFQYYAFVANTNGYCYRKWHDFNVGNETEVRPVVGNPYIVQMKGLYLEDSRREINTLAISVKDGYNDVFHKQFVGNLVNADGGIGGTTRLNSVEFTGDGVIETLDGAYSVNRVNANLARVDGVEYPDVATAVAAAADGKDVWLLHAASWKPTAADIGKPIKFLNKGDLVLDDSELPFGMRPVWSGVDGNNGTLTLTQLYGGLRKIVPYLHEIWYEGYEDSNLEGDDAPFGDLPVKGLGGCSSVRVGNFHGRNLDIAVSDLASMVIHMAATSNRFASVGTTQWFDVSETALTNGAVSAHRFDVLPNWMLDGINEKGVAINVNIIPMDVPQDGEDPGSDTRPALHARKVARYVLDHAESAAGVIEQLKGFRVFGNIGAVENNIHWMISDAEKTFVVEVIKGEVVAREHPIMTNFNINWDNENQRAIDPSEYENWGPEKYFWAAAHSNDTDTIFKTYSLHAEGIERYIRLRDNDGGYLKRGATFEGMFDLMRETQYSKIAYLPLAETYLSDLLDMQEVRNEGFKSLEDIYAASNAAKLAEMWETLRPKMTNVYENLAKYRKPDAMVPYSITTHNVTFDLENKLFRIVVQEDYDHAFDFFLAEPKGTPDDPWLIGADNPTGVTAWTNGTTLVVEGRGAMKDFTAEDLAPWGTGIAAVDFGAQVTNFGANAFAGCAALKTLTMRGNPPAIGPGNDLTGAVLTVREDAKAKFEDADGWRDCAVGTVVPVGYDYANVKTLAPFLHEVRYTKDYVSATDSAISENPSTAAAFACSAVRKGNFLGRNFDYFLNDVPTFVVRMDAAPGRLASVGVAQQWGMHEDGVTNGQYTASYDLVPVMMLDGVNECGVVVEDNVVLAGDCGELTGTNPGKPDLNISYVLRYVLDHATNAAHGVELIKSRNLVGGIGGHFYLHYMIADAKETYVVEVITNTVVARHMDIMTNFNLNWDNGNQCAISDVNSNGWAAVDYPAPWSNEVNVATIDERYSSHADGVERFLILRDSLDQHEDSLEGMFKLMQLVKYTNLGKEVFEGTDVAWLTEYSSASSITNLYRAFKDEATHDDLMESYNAMAREIRADFARKEQVRKENTGNWQTVHNTTYDIEKRMFRIAVQEDYDRTFDIWLSNPLAPGQSSEPFDSEELARAAIESGAVSFAPAPDVEKVLLDSIILTIDGYKAMFAPVIYPSADKYRVMYALTENATNALEQSVHDVVTNLNLAAIAAAPEEGVDLSLKGGVPGFYYTLFKSAAVTNVLTDGSHDKANSDRLCDKDGVVTFQKVTKPSAAAGFFTVRASPEQVFTGEADIAGAIVVISPILIKRAEP